MEGVSLGTAFASLIKRLAVLEAEARPGRRWWRTK